MIRPYRQLIVARVGELSAGQHLLFADAGDAPGLRLDADDWQLAQLFDGERSAVERLKAAHAAGLAVGAARLEGLADRLTRAGLLRRGAREPLPVPAQSIDEERQLGWTDGGLGRAGRSMAAGALPPSSMPGSRVSPGLLGGLAGLIGRRGRANRISLPLAPGFFVALGAPFAAPMATTARLYLLLFTALGLGIAFFEHRYAALPGLKPLLLPYPFVLTAIGAGYLINLLSMSARAAAIVRWTPVTPKLGIRFGLLGIPHLFVDTGGGAELADRAARLRIIGAPLAATLLLFVLAVVYWFMSHAGGAPLAGPAVVVMALCASSLFIRANPAVRRDGYYLLLNLFKVGDVREAAMLAVFGGKRRPWATARRDVPMKWLKWYAALVVVFYVTFIALVMAFTGSWLVERLRGFGFLFIAVVMGAFMYKQRTDSVPSRSNLGWTYSWWPFSVKTTWIALTVLLIGLIPYPYEPAGDLVVLPRAQADVRALVAGDVREVLVKEGDEVKAGQVIVRLADGAYAAKLAADEAQLASLKADLALAGKGGKPAEIEVARQAVATAKTKAEFSRINAQRLAQAYQRKAVTSQEYDRARGQAEVDAQMLREAQQQLALVSSPAASDRIESLKADIQRAEAQLKFSRQQLSYTEVSSPIDGRIVSGTLQFARGNYLAIGERVAVVEDAGEKLAEIKIPEASIGAVAVGKRAAAKSWAYPWTSFPGTVHAIAPAAEDSPYGKIIRVQMRVDDPRDQLRSGMTGSAKIDGGLSLAGIVFTKALVRFVFVEVWSWLP